MRVNICTVKGRDIKSFHTRSWKMDNNKIWVGIDKLPAMVLMDVNEILKIETAFKNQKFQVFRKTAAGPMYVEVYNDS